jgi:hypothetical protein
VVPAEPGSAVWSLIHALVVENDPSSQPLTTPELRPVVTMFLL